MLCAAVFGVGLKLFGTEHAEFFFSKIQRESRAREVIYITAGTFLASHQTSSTSALISADVPKCPLGQHWDMTSTVPRVSLQTWSCMYPLTEACTAYGTASKWLAIMPIARNLRPVTLCAMQNMTL
jgi:hypothetical protein